MTATLPADVQDVLERATSVELVTVDDHGRPVVRSVVPAYHAGEACIDVVPQEPTGAQVALLFCQDDRAPVVLVQGTAQETAEVVHIRPERVYVWPGASEEPRLFDAHLEEVLSGHNEEPEVGHAGPEGGAGVWDPRLDDIRRGVLACVGPDGFPFAVALEVASDARDTALRFPTMPVGMPAEPGPACVHCTGGPLVRGDLQDAAGGWQLVPHAVLAG